MKPRERIAAFIATGVLLLIIAGYYSYRYYQRQQERQQVAGVYTTLIEHRLEALTRLKYLAYNESSPLKRRLDANTIYHLNTLANDLLDYARDGRSQFWLSTKQKDADIELSALMERQWGAYDLLRKADYRLDSMVGSRVHAFYELERLLIKTSRCYQGMSDPGLAGLDNPDPAFDLQPALDNYLKFRQGYISDNAQLLHRLTEGYENSGGHILHIGNDFYYFHPDYPRENTDQWIGDRIRYLMGLSFEYGIGCPANNVHATYWYQQAIARGSHEAKDALIRLQIQSENSAASARGKNARNRSAQKPAASAARQETNPEAAEVPNAETPSLDNTGQKVSKQSQSGASTASGEKTILEMLDEY